MLRVSYITRGGKNASFLCMLDRVPPTCSRGGEGPRLGGTWQRATGEATTTQGRGIHYATAGSTNGYVKRSFSLAFPLLSPTRPKSPLWKLK
jgi:hypothetical protein